MLQNRLPGHRPFNLQRIILFMKRRCCNDCMTDAYSHMSVDYETIYATTDPAEKASEVRWNVSNNTGL